MKMNMKKPKLLNRDPPDWQMMKVDAAHRLVELQQKMVHQNEETNDLLRAISMQLNEYINRERIKVIE